MSQKKRQTAGKWSFLERDKTIHMFATGAPFLPKYLWRGWKPALKSRNMALEREEEDRAKVEEIKAELVKSGRLSVK